MTEADKQKLVAQFNDLAVSIEAVTMSAKQGFVIGSLTKQLGQSIDAIKTQESNDAASHAAA